MVYRDVTFGIHGNSEGFAGYSSTVESMQATEEALRLFCSDGWEARPKENSCYADVVRKGRQHLKISSMEIIGFVDQEEIPQIEALLATAKSFCWRCTDLHTVYEDLDDETYLARLESKREEIIAAILELFKTERRNLYVPSTAKWQIIEQFNVRHCNRKSYGNRTEIFVQQLMDQLISEGRLITKRTKKYGLGLRAATKADKRPATIE